MKELNIKKTLIYILLAALLIPAASHAQNRFSILNAMEEIKKRHNVTFIYDSSLETQLSQTIEQYRPSNRLERSLEQIFKNSGINWKRHEGNHIVLSAPRPGQAIEFEQNPMQDTLNASIVTSDKYLQKLRSTSTGIEKLDGTTFNKGFAVLSSPDVIKTIQNLPGVASGTELLSGLYVHGGTGYDNLYLLDGVPLYQVSHLAGLFSSFNTDIIDNVDFYKSGFPARFGGRMSSIVDISTKDGDMNDYHGLVSVGLLDGRVQFEGPIIKDKTSFNVAMRRSWLDVFSTPVLAIVNSASPDMKTKLHYIFGDYNVKITHLFSPENKLTGNIYYGRDNLKFGFDYIGQYSDGMLVPGTENLIDSDGLGLRWGNILTSLRWQNRFAENLTSDIKAYYSGYSSGTDYFSYFWIHTGDVGYQKDGSLEDGYSRIHDIATTADFKWEPTDRHALRFGASYTYHIYNHYRKHEEYPGSSEGTTQIKEESSSAGSHETALYVEDELSVWDWFKAGIGLRYAAFSTQGRTYHKVEPRAALNFFPTRNLAIKMSYTEMNQYIHNLSTSNIDLPTTIMLPSTITAEPMFSRQFAAGIYSILPAGFTLDLEGYYKTLEHLHEYNGYSMLYPPLEGWEKMFPEGQGLSYGFESSLGYNTEKNNISIAYTLSWTLRKFDDICTDWFLNWNDNRHKLTISAVHKFSRRFDVYAAWNYRSGNRMSVNAHDIDYYPSYEFPFAGQTNSPIGSTPYNVQMPAYHRLDVGMNFRKETKRGNESVWNVSIYNAYCRMNPMYAEIETDENGDAIGVATGIIPLIPSFSYTLKF